MDYSYMDSGSLGAAVAFPLILMVFMIVVGWKIFVKAGKPGWAVLIPIYNIIVMLEVVNRPLWWIILLLIPLVNIVVGIMIIVDLAKSFGKGGAFALGMIVLSIIFYPILAFGGSQYQKIER